MDKNTGIRKTTSQFVREAKKIFGDYYDYSLVKYINNRTKVKIICPKEGICYQRPDHHLAGQRCKNRPKNSKENYYTNNLPLFSTYAKQLQPFGVECRECSKDIYILEVQCYNCKIWYVPSATSVDRKINSLKNIGRGERNLYCSKKCKTSCDTYKQITYTKEHRPSTSREVQAGLRALRLEIDGNECQACFSKDNLQCHHYDGVELNPIESADLDRCIIICKKCHRELHKIPGYTYEDFKRKPCRPT